MSKIPVPQLGRHLTVCTIDTVTIGSDGTWTPGGSPVVLLAQFEGGDFSGSPDREEINAMNTVRRNEVVISDGDSLTLHIFKINNGSDPDPLITLWQGGDYFQIAWTIGTTAGSIESNVFNGVRGEISSPFSGRGKQVAQLSLGPVDIGGPQFVRTLS